MPGPDPDGISLHFDADGRSVITAELWTSRLPPFTGCTRTRTARARAVLRNVCRGGWCCLQCGGPVPIWRRADAVYCSEGCRKRAKRGRMP